jgi:hypothetical protein
MDNGAGRMILFDYCGTTAIASISAKNRSVLILLRISPIARLHTLSLRADLQPQRL